MQAWGVFNNLILRSLMYHDEVCWCAKLITFDLQRYNGTIVNMMYEIQGSISKTTQPE